LNQNGEKIKINKNMPKPIKRIKRIKQVKRVERINQIKKTDKVNQRKWGLAKRLEHTRIKGNQKRK